MTKRSRIPLLVAALTLAGMSRMSMASPSELPSTFVSVGPMSVSKASTYTLACSTGPEGINSLFFAERYDVTDGYGAGWGAGSNGRGGVQVRVADQRVEVVQDDDLASSGSFVQSGSLPAGSLYRLAVGSWGGTLSCRFSLNGKNIKMTVRAPEGGIHLDPIAYPGGLGANAYGLGALAGGTHVRPTHGFLFAFLPPLFGATLVQGPEGQVYGGVGVFESWVAIAEPTSGDWRYTVGAGVLPDLWILELPA